MKPTRKTVFGGTALLCGLFVFGVIQGTGLRHDQVPLSSHSRLSPHESFQPTFDGPSPPAGASRFRTRLSNLSRLTGQKLFFAPVVIEDQEAELLLDTGAPVSLLHGDFALRCGLRITEKIGVMEAPLVTELHGRSIGLAWSRPGRFSLAGFELSGRGILVSELRSRFRLLGLPILRFDGIIGLDVLRAFSLTLDFKTKQAELDTTPTSASGVTIPLALDPPGPNARVWIAAISPKGPPVLFQLDTAASGPVLITQEAERALGIRDHAAHADLILGALTLPDAPIRRAHTNLIPAERFSRISPRITLDLPRGLLVLAGPVNRGHVPEPVSP